MAKLGETIRRGMFAPVRALLPKNPWLRVLVYALPVLLLLALFGPALDLVLKVFDLILRVLEPMLHTTVGRVLVVLGLTALVVLVASLLLRRRLREWRAEAALGRHLRATAKLVGRDRRSARDAFRRVAQYRGPAPSRYPALAQDATLKLARLALAEGEVDAALGWITKVIEPGLPKELERSLLQLRLEALRRQGQVLPATLRREAEAAAQRFRGDVAVLRTLRDLCEAEDAHDEALQWQARVVENAPPVDAGAERQRHVDMLVAAGERALHEGDHDRARKLSKQLRVADQDGTSSAILTGDVHRALGEHRKAVRAYGSAASPLGLDRIAELLSEHPGAVDTRELLASCPMQGVLLLVARELARSGEHARAERAARLAADALGPTPTVCAVLAEVLELLGDERRALLLREQTLARLLTPAP